MLEAKDCVLTKQILSFPQPRVPLQNWINLNISEAPTNKAISNAFFSAISQSSSFHSSVCLGNIRRIKALEVFSRNFQMQIVGLMVNERQFNKYFLPNRCQIFEQSSFILLILPNIWRKR